jgi:hypothetical protein
MRKIVIRSAAGILLLLLALGPMVPATGQLASLPAACSQMAFSTEEDFVTQGPVPPGGNIISDGDLLGANCTVCARNADLLKIFQVEYDLGLDAVDVLDAETSLVAFSTSLNSSNQGQFTAGDLLFTTGVIIPNQALTYAFGQGTISYDIGLDAVHFVGTLENILAVLERWANLEPPIGPSQLYPLLEEYGVDIWYSTEGTWSATGAPMVLDGDLLSAQTGAIVVSNHDLLPNPDVPAGLPDRGVDFGLDAATTSRDGFKDQIHFSTEILFDGEISFTDGDVLLVGDGIAIPHPDLVRCFEPHANFLGLDALHMALEEPQPAEIHGLKFHDLDANGARDASEPGLERWMISLDGTDLAGNVVHLETLTGASGVYSFTVPAGTYSVTETCLDETWYQSQPPPVEGCGSGVHQVAPAPGEVMTDRDFGNYRYAVKSGFKFNDLDQDGRWNEQEEPGLAEWDIRLEGADGMGQDIKLQTFTDATGYYSFTVPPGAYTVYEVCPGGWMQTLPQPPGVCGSGVYAFNPLSGDPEHTGNNFGNVQSVGIYLPIVLKEIN